MGKCRCALSATNRRFVRLLLTPRNWHRDSLMTRGRISSLRVNLTIGMTIVMNHQKFLYAQCGYFCHSINNRYHLRENTKFKFFTKNEPVKGFVVCVSAFEGMQPLFPLRDEENSSRTPFFPRQRKTSHDIYTNAFCST